MLVLDYEMAMLPLPAWLWTDLWPRLARDPKGGRGGLMTFVVEVDELASSTRQLWFPPHLHTRPPRGTPRSALSLLAWAHASGVEVRSRLCFPTGLRLLRDLLQLPRAFSVGADAKTHSYHCRKRRRPTRSRSRSQHPLTSVSVRGRRIIGSLASAFTLSTSFVGKGQASMRRAGPCAGYPSSERGRMGTPNG
jgi:hypothetical protein